MKKRYKIYLLADQRTDNHIVIEHIVGHMWLPRINKKIEPSKTLKLPCQLTKSWIKEKVFFKAVNIDKVSKIVYVVIVQPTMPQAKD